MYRKENRLEKPNILVLKTCKMLRKGCEGFLTYVVGNEEIKNNVDNIHVIRKFLDVIS